MGLISAVVCVRRRRYDKQAGRRPCLSLDFRPRKRPSMELFFREAIHDILFPLFSSWGDLISLLFQFSSRTCTAAEEQRERGKWYFVSVFFTSGKVGYAGPALAIKGHAAHVTLTLGHDLGLAHDVAGREDLCECDSSSYV